MAKLTTVHDLNNSLLAIRAYVELLQQGDLDPKARERVDGIAEEVAQAALLTRHLVGSTDAPAANGASPRATCRERILLVEDKEPLRRLVTEALTRYGYVVTAANGSEEALLSAHAGDDFDLLITDVVIPGMTGQELAERVGKLHPRTRTIYMSGHSKQAAVDHHGLEQGAVFLRKPFSLDALAATVREILGGVAGGA